MSSNKVSSPVVYNAVLAKMNAAGKLTSRETVCETFAAMVTELQKDYTGALVRMTPTNMTWVPGTTMERWSMTFAFTVLEVCARHNRTEEQVMAALDVVLGVKS